MTEAELVAILAAALNDVAPRCSVCDAIATWSGGHRRSYVCAEHLQVVDGKYLPQFENKLLAAAVKALKAWGETGR